LSKRQFGLLILSHCYLSKRQFGLLILSHCYLSTQQLDILVTCLLIYLTTVKLLCCLFFCDNIPLTHC
jgi:hypothetical protein